MVDPRDLATARRALGAQLAACREAAGFIQKRLAKEINYHRSSVANVETGRQRVPREFWISCDRVLGTGTALVDGYDELEHLSRVSGSRRRMRRAKIAKRGLGRSP